MTRTAGEVTAPSGASSAPSGISDPAARERIPWLLAFLCLLIPILPSYVVLAGPLKSNGSPARMIAILMLTLMILGFFLVRRTAPVRYLHPGVVLILTYVFLVLLVWGVGVSHFDTALVETNKPRAIVVVLTNVGLALYATVRVSTYRQRSIVLGCLATGLTFNCVVGFLQNTVNVDLHLLFRAPGLIINEVSSAVSISPTLSERYGAERAFGTSQHAIEFAVLCAIAVPLALHFARYAEKRQTRLFAALAVGAALLAMPTAIARSGVVALAAALLVYVWTFKLRDVVVAATVAVLALAVETAANPGTVAALWTTITNSGEDESVGSRVAAYAKVSQTFHDHPLFGLGLGGSPPTQYGFLDNEWLQALVQGGVIGLLAMMVLAIGGLFGISAALRCATNRRERDQALAMGGMFTGILASSFTFDLFAHQQASLVFFMLFGLLWSNFRLTTSPPDAWARGAPAVPSFVG